MNAPETKLIDCLIGDNEIYKDRALQKLFFATRRDSDDRRVMVMGPYQKAAFDAIMRKFCGTRYKGIDVFTRYDTAMSAVIDSLIKALRNERELYFKEVSSVDSCNPPRHWTSKFDNLPSFVCKVIEREANRRRSQIDGGMGLQPIDFQVETLDDRKKFDSDGEDDDIAKPLDVLSSTVAIHREDTAEEPQPSNDGMNPEDDLQASDYESDNVDDNQVSSRTILLSALYEAISNLKSEKDRDIVKTIFIGGMSDEEYAASRKTDINGVYRDKARARDRLIVEMINPIRHSCKSMVRKYSYVLDDESSELINDIVIKEISFRDIAQKKGCNVSAVQTKFTSAYSKIIKENNNVYGEQLNRINKQEKMINKLYTRFLKSLKDCNAIYDNNANSVESR